MSQRVAREILIRGLGFSLVLAAGSWAWQAEGLVGARGITPAGAPTAMLCAVCLAVGIGLVASVGFEAPLLLIGWAAWLAVVDAGGIWLAFQWDSLLVESLLAAVVVARWGRGPKRDPPAWAWALVWLLVARLMFFGGIAKILSGDPSWRDGTALTWHFWTQPLPNPVSPWLWTAPGWISAVGVALTHLVELVLPFLILAGWRGRAVAATGFTGLMLMLGSTGNYGYFQVLAIVLSLALVDDRVWRVAVSAAEPRQGWRAHALAPLAAILALLAFAQGLVSLRIAPEPVIAVVRAADPWRSVNRYGLFATMTRDRPEIALEVDEGAGWQEWPFVWKPGDLDRRPPQSAPHLPRLEWRLWFAALGTCERNRWVLRFEQLVLDREPSVVALLGPDPLDGRAIRRVRTVRWMYRPGATTFWVRGDARPYCPQYPPPER